MSTETGCEWAKGCAGVTGLKHAALPAGAKGRECATACECAWSGARGRRARSSRSEAAGALPAASTRGADVRSVDFASRLDVTLSPAPPLPPPPPCAASLLPGCAVASASAAEGTMRNTAALKLFNFVSSSSSLCPMARRPLLVLSVENCHTLRNTLVPQQPLDRGSTHPRTNAPTHRT